MNIKDRIFYGAMEELRDSGAKFTMDSLAKRLGMSKRTLYETIPSKNEVIEMVIDRTFADVKLQQQMIFEDQEMDMVQKLKKLLTIIPFHADILDYRRVNELKGMYPYLYQKINDNINNDWERTIALLEEGMAAGVIKRRNMVVLKMLLCEVFTKLLEGSYLIQNNITYKTAMNEVMAIVFEGILEKGSSEKTKEVVL